MAALEHTLRMATLTTASHSCNSSLPCDENANRPTYLFHYDVDGVCVEICVMVESVRKQWTHELASVLHTCQSVLNIIQFPNSEIAHLIFHIIFLR
jgi:hypothetical protein